jgi:hypothetical protein
VAVAIEHKEHLSMTTSTRIQPTQPQGIGPVLDTAFQLYKTSLFKVWPISLLLAIVNGVPAVYWSIRAQEMVQRAGDALSFTFSGSDMLVIGLSIIFSIWVMGALYLKQSSIGTNEPLGTGAALVQALRRLPAMMAASLLIGVVVLTGLMLLVIPGLLLAVSLMPYMAVMLLENRGIVDSLLRSHRLVWGNWWRTSIVLTVGSILVMVIFFALGMVLGIAAPFAGLMVQELARVIELGMGVAFNMVVMPFVTAMVIALYWDLKLRKDGADLVARVNTLNAA